MIVNNWVVIIYGFVLVFDGFISNKTPNISSNFEKPTGGGLQFSFFSDTKPLGY